MTDGIGGQYRINAKGKRELIERTKDPRDTSVLSSSSDLPLSVSPLIPMNLVNTQEEEDHD